MLAKFSFTIKDLCNSYLSMCEHSQFLLYPHRSRERRTKTTVEDREIAEKMLAEGVEGRRTFGSYVGNKIGNDSIALDDIYCRERLHAAREIVHVTLKLAALLR